jgi:hypothetical protein
MWVACLHYVVPNRHTLTQMDTRYSTVMPANAAIQTFFLDSR